MSKANHIHRFRKVNIGNNGKEYLVYQCSKPACSYYIAINLSLGKLSECNRCKSPMIMGKTQLYGGNAGGPMAKPHCTDCVKRKGKANDAAITVLAEFLAEKKI